jgi:hypothetical protein
MDRNNIDNEKRTEEEKMLLRNNLHTEYFSVRRLLPQSTSPEIPFLDGDILLDHHLWILSLHKGARRGDFHEEGHFEPGRGARSCYLEI